MKQRMPRIPKPAWERIRPHVLPIFQTSVYDYPDLQTLDDYYAGLISGSFIYSRNGLPNSRQLGTDLARLEGAETSVVFSSGMAAISVLILALLKHGDCVVSSSDVYGGTTVLLREELPRLGISSEFMDPSDISSARRVIKRAVPKLVLVETISNPTMKVCDIEEIAKIAHSSGALLAVDNTFATPFVTRPIAFGADFTIHSGTKFLGGHSDLTLGVICGKEKHLERIQQLNARLGAISGPFDSWLASRSLSTWKIRMKSSCSNALRLARFLESQKETVSRVYYPGLEEGPDFNVARRLFAHGMFGAMLSFDLKGGLKGVDTFVRALSHITLTPSLGGVRTTISHPGKTSHRHVGRLEKKRMGISDSMIRVSLGVEDYEDIEKEFALALKKTMK